MNKKGNASLTMLMAVLCMAIIFSTAGIGGASAAQSAGGLLDDCATYRTFQDVNEQWREGLIRNRDLVLAEAKAVFEENSGVDPTCSAQELDDLKQEALGDVYRLSDQLSQSDKVYLSSLSVDLTEALARGAAASSEQAQAGPPVAVPTTFDRVAKALAEGRIGLKDSVLLRAKLIYAPGLVPPESEFAPRPGENVGGGATTSFLMDVHRVKNLLDNNEKAFLRSLSPELDAIVRSWLGVAPAVLPSYPDLTLKAQGKTCTVNYTTTSTSPNVTTAAYAIKVAAQIDTAVVKETKDFHAAYPEGGGKMQVYAVGATNATLGGNAGLFVPVSAVAGSSNQFSGYILMNVTNSASTQEAVSYHEYFHGVQAAYNGFSDPWFQEGSANWAAGYYGNDANCWAYVSYFYTIANSMFNNPNDVLWDVTGNHQYSTSVLVFFYSGKYGGAKFVVAYFAASMGQNDAITNLTTALGGTSFGDSYIQFLLALYNKDIPSITKHVKMPDVKLQATETDYGVNPSDSVFLLGANFYKLSPPSDSRLQKAAFIATLMSTGSGSPVGVLAEKGSTKLATVTDGRAWLPNSEKEAVYIATDTTYTSQDAAARTYQATVVTPWIQVDKIDAVSPIQAGDTSNITVTYDLLGTVAGQPFGTTLKIIEKASNVNDHATGDYNVSVGMKQTFPLYFQTSSGSRTGPYNFTLQFAVPLDSWKIPQVTSPASQGKFLVVVTPSSGASSPMKGGAIAPVLGTAR
jgi:hypothetical protein